MTGSSPRGLLTDEERELLVGEKAPSEAGLNREELMSLLQDRIHATLEDFEFLYLVLTDAELASIFDESPDQHSRSIRASAQYLLAFLYLGLQSNGDEVEFRLASAIRQAEASQDRHATVQLDIVAEPFLPPEQRLEAIRGSGFQRVSYEGFEQLFYDDRVDSAELASVLSSFGEEEVTPEMIRREHEAFHGIKRPPTSIVVDVQPASPPDDTADGNGASDSDARGGG